MLEVETGAIALGNQKGFSAAHCKVELPKALHGKSLIIEVNSNDLQRFKTFFSAQLSVQVNEDFGELRVFNKAKKPLSHVYVKVFYKDKDGSEKFWRDGFTDIRGRFEYANASGKNLDNVKKFAIFFDHKTLGSMIKEVNKPSKH